MGQKFISVDREQVFLMPPSVVDWVPEDHLVWSVLGAVEELDLAAFYAAYRADGHGRPAYVEDPCGCLTPVGPRLVVVVSATEPSPYGAASP